MSGRHALIILLHNVNNKQTTDVGIDHRALVCISSIHHTSSSLFFLVVIDC